MLGGHVTAASSADVYCLALVFDIAGTPVESSGSGQVPLNFLMTGSP